jgi:hypothetical protein
VAAIGSSRPSNRIEFPQLARRAMEGAGIEQAPARDGVAGDWTRLAGSSKSASPKFESGSEDLDGR